MSHRNNHKNLRSAWRRCIQHLMKGDPDIGVDKNHKFTRNKRRVDDNETSVFYTGYRSYILRSIRRIVSL